MADFNPGVQPVEAQPMRPIVVGADTSTANAIQSGGNILGVIGSTIANGIQGAAVAAQNKESGRRLNELQQNLLRVSDLEQSGDMKPEVAARQYRITMARALANNYGNPALTKQMMDTYKDIVATPGLGQNIAKDFQQEKDNANDLHMQALKTAQAAGWGSPNMSSAEQDLWSEKHQQFLYAQGQIEAANKVLDHKIKENNLVTSGLAITQARQGIVSNGLTIQSKRLQLARDVAQNQLIGGVQNLSDSYFPKWNADLANLEQKVRSGKMTAEEAMKAAQQQHANIQKQVSNISLAHSDPGVISPFMKPFDMTYQNFVDNISGKNVSGVAANQLSAATNLQALQLTTHNPDLLKISGLSKILPAGMGPMLTTIANATTKAMVDSGFGQSGGAQNSQQATPVNPLSNGTPESKSGMSTYYDIIKRAQGLFTSNPSNKELGDELDGVVKNVLHGVGVYGSTAQSPANMTEVVKYLASPEFGQYVKQHPEAVSGDNAEQARQVYSQFYQAEVLPRIQNEFINQGMLSKSSTQTGTTTVITPRGVPIPKTVMTENSKLYHATWNGVGVSFVANDPKEMSNPYAVNKLRELNTQVAPVMTTLIHAQTNLAGSNDYRSAFNAMLDEISTNVAGAGEQ